MRLRSSARMPSASASEESAPGLTPNMKRPLARWSNIAACAAITTGCDCERLEVPVASLIVLVSPISVARKMKLLVTFSQRSVRCSPAKAPAALPARAGPACHQDPCRTGLRPAQVRPGIRLDESTVIKYLSMAGGDPEQAERLRRFMLASAAYATCIPLVWLASKFN